MTELISALALLVAVTALWRTISLDKIKHAKSVSIFYSAAEGEITHANCDEIILRNDGENSIVIELAGMAYGDTWVNDRRKPEAWTVDYLPLTRAEALLSPGEQLVLKAPEARVSLPIVGPVIHFRDSDGRKWQKTLHKTTHLRDRRGLPSRRRMWFDSHGWGRKLKNNLTKVAIKQQERNPAAWPAIGILVEFLWGWPIGIVRRELQPYNAPQGWKFAMHWGPAHRKKES
ncbi:hypothetical protein [Arthrobacter mangrovi]|uniref:hypothetical protein n=1 Tax=Arthrobacter mangrovi TaxID=2966350 RepID=UPI00223083D1|nr:hypothetical protein [Arthrobacter mangrovi]